MLFFLKGDFGFVSCVKMAGKGVKLISLKVRELKEELEERDLDTSRTKAVLQNRLRQALSEEAIDPDKFLFETSDLGSF